MKTPLWAWRLLASAERILHYEYWPAKVFYLPLIPYVAWLGLRHGGFCSPSAANPGIENGGGFVGESKHRIMRGLGDGPAVVATRLIPAGTIEDRMATLRAEMAGIAWPVILKPDEGQRGHGVRLIADEAKARAYFTTMTADAVVQPFHPGPHECGVLWIRDVGGEHGRVFSITRKEFPEVTGDGRRSVEELILRHPRHRRQWRVFLERLGAGRSRVPEAGERVALGLCGNHCQGSRFRDGADLMTPELATAIDRLASGFRGVNAGPLDFGRFDIRYTSEEALRRGEGFAIVELNGVTSESTNIYDPSWPLWRAYSTLFAQWRELYKLGAWRRGLGTKVVSVGTVLAWLREHRGTRAGSALSD